MKDWSASVHGEAFAAWIHDKPVMKAVVRTAMDAVLTLRGAAIAAKWGIDLEGIEGFEAGQP